ncbi:receptor-associated protein [Suhomyces tanzawaensis NRRL Y-17324]|uniref:Endoplasmic reticulum transmembrane protein n=1 Tax=Suhomyces tanzawaensis NRRL Y-17324 TaxID=984487 RepID=A0A1E4SJT5_9ASCO|nr:receptor-associated protein [Suhomyces tanzawaensis NRRL Y-17324]ODV79758.1 receptor-associated protein [Suhomyces tanzawaensis NRRL Y-17324]
MALYYNLVFGLLIVEMVFFTILSLPYPRNIRRTVLTTVSAPFRNEQFQIAIKCILGFILVLFIDSVNRVYSVTSELRAASPSGHQTTVTGIMNDRSEVQARRFYAQRNMYLCGFTLFLTLIITRTYSLVAELIATKDKLDAKKVESGSTDAAEDSEKIAALKKELAARDEDLEILKDQAKNLTKDYDSVATGVDKSGL